MKRTELQQFLDQLLDCGRFSDYCPNGLQVEGRAQIGKVVCGVSASRALIEYAIACKADAIVVHHGWFWRGEEVRVTGIRRERLGLLLAHDINLFGYHLPLDAHPQLGNNAQLAKVLGWRMGACVKGQALICLGEPEVAVTARALAEHVGRVLQRAPLLVGDAERVVRRVAWCTGGAQDYLEQAIAAGADMYVSGEISERTVHLARESGVPYLAAGHHATERYGIRALSAYLAEHCGLDCEFVDLDNPV